MDYFNYNMRQNTGATQSLTLSDMDQYFRKDYSGNILIKVDEYSQIYVSIKDLMENIEHLGRQVNEPNTHPQLQNTMEAMAEALNILAEENELLKQKMDEMEMRIGDN